MIAEGEYYGMQTFDQALLKHVVARNITEETAFEVASSAHDFKLMLAAQGQRASGIEQVIGDGDDARRLTSVRKALSYTRPGGGGAAINDFAPCPASCK